ncbi:protein of unknown function [Burkholderia multivorans]
MSLIQWSEYQVGEHRIACPDCNRGEHDNALTLVINADGSGEGHCARCSFTESHRPEGHVSGTVSITSPESGVTPSPAASPILAKPEPLSDGIIIVNGADMKPEPISWLWRGYMARGKMTNLAGEPGTGKTTVAGSLAATTTCGGTWPDGTTAEPGNVVIWSGEDDPEDTLAPRLISAGADMSRVFFVTGMRENSKERSFDPARDMPALQAKCESIGDVRLIVVDPIVSAVAGDSHKNAETRRALQPLVDLAANVGAALLGITHFNKGRQGKNPAQWVNGSVAFTAIARVVIIAAKVVSDDGDEHRIFARAKSNIGPDEGGFEYQVEQSEPIPGIESSCIAWGDEVAGSALELLGNQTKGKASGGSAVNSAQAFLADLLSGSEMPVKSIEADAAAAGIALRTLRRAADALGVEKHKGKDTKWYWSLPAKPSIVASAERLDNMDNMTKPANSHLRLVPNPEVG